MTAPDRAVGDLLRELAPQVLGVLVRRHGQFDHCEDAVQEALLAAAQQWPAEGLPGNPRGWLLTVATRRLTDEWRSESARRRRETEQAIADPEFGTEPLAPAPDDVEPATDDSLTLLLMCCHPALSAPSQLALTLRAVGGLTTAEVAAACLVPEATMAQRISRAKKTVKGAAGGFALPAGEARLERLPVVLHVLYLIFNEGYTATSGDDLQRPELAAEAIRLTRAVARALPEDGEVTGLLALMLLTEARAAARTDAAGRLVPLAEQDRTLWDGALIAEGVELISRALATSPLGPYQLQAAIAAVHAEAKSDADTDWAQIAILYGLLDGMAPNPMVTLNRAVAVAQVDGPQAGLALLAPLDADERVARHHRLAAVRAHLLEMAGDVAAAREQFREAARRTTSLPERDYLEKRAAALA
ncbi:RNA polymerase sigma factor [Pseudonocardia sp. CA-107938]|uniref:RNA polymerase sigma factor n=1 Tax=Pseudonocardia sp. CA-107938 TaxID=3240021 RepID=UPI003D8DDF38